METSQLTQFDGNLLDGLDFCSKVYALYELIRNGPDGPSRMRIRRRLEKKLLEELLPICKYLQASYSPGHYISVRWVNGSQQYDAELLQRGAHVDQARYPEEAFLEVTCVMHPNDYLLRQLLNTKGIAFGIDGIRRLENGEIESVPVAYNNWEFVHSYAKLVVAQIAKKAKIPYPNNTILIVQCTLNRPYMQDEWDELISEIRASLPLCKFREIYLYDNICQYSQTLYPHKASLITS